MSYCYLCRPWKYAAVLKSLWSSFDCSIHQQTSCSMQCHATHSCTDWQKCNCWTANTSDAESAALVALLFTLSELVWKNESRYLTICKIMTPKMWRMICNIFYCVWVVYPGSRLRLPRMLIVRCLIFIGCQTASVSLEPDENEASLKTALHDHALDSDITVCSSHSSCS